jgi:Domain of unknown function (DUF3854)
MNFPLSKLPQPSFIARMETEFLQGSAIDRDLYQTAVHLVGDIEVLPGGDVAYPLHEALNWRVTRFGYQARSTQEAALLVNEDGSIWQAKLSQPTLDLKKGKLRKYETPLGNGSRAYLPPINRETRRLIAQRYDVDVPPPDLRFWDWLQQHPEISIVLTEGGKKSLSLLSQGYVAIALYGVNGGYLKLPGDTRELIPDLIPFCQPDRSFLLAFDQDEKDSTRRQVNVAIHRFGGLLAQTGSEVKVAQWEPNQGKGVDDLIVQGGAAAWDVAYTQALPLEHWQILQHLKRTLTIRAALQVSTPDLDTLDPATLPDQGLIAIASGKGTGKTKLVQRIVKASDKALAVVHRIALARNLSVRLGLDYRGDLDKAIEPVLGSFDQSEALEVGDRFAEGILGHPGELLQPVVQGVVDPLAAVNHLPVAFRVRQPVV